MPYSGNDNVEYHANEGSWKCCLSNKPERKLEVRLHGAFKMHQAQRACGIQPRVGTTLGIRYPDLMIHGATPTGLCPVFAEPHAMCPPSMAVTPPGVAGRMGDDLAHKTQGSTNPGLNYGTPSALGQATEMAWAFAGPLPLLVTAEINHSTGGPRGGGRLCGWLRRRLCARARPDQRRAGFLCGGWRGFRPWR
jgi:hypothetical protein